MKKILYVATVDIHIKSFHLPYLKMLKENGYEVHVATNGDEQFPYCDVKHKICIERSPFKLNNLKAIKQLKRIIDEEKFDIIHCHTPMGSVVTRLAAKEARKNGTRVIYTCHGFHFYKGAPIKNWLLFYPVEWYLAKFTDTLITINQEDYKRAQKKFGKRCKDIQYVPGVGIDTKKFDFEMPEDEKVKIKENLGVKKDEFVLIYPARLCQDKNQILILNLMKKIDYKDVVLLLPGKDEYKGYYQQYVKENKIKNVKFLGERMDIPKLLKVSDLLIASSVREGFGINLVEALINGIPVIAVDNRGHREIIEDGINGFIIDNDINDLIDKFNCLYMNRSLYEQLRDNCYESSKKYFLINSLNIMKKIYKL